MERRVLVAIPVAVAEEVVPGSVQGTCSQCGCPVFIAPSGQRLMSQHPMEVMCLVCFGSLKVSAEEVMDMLPEQEQEFRQTLGYPPAIKTGAEILEAIEKWKGGR